MKTKISVIVPAYNAEKYVVRCIDCLKRQTFKDFEVIFINDGSTDMTLELLNKHKTKNMTIINKHNSGVSSARNNGLKVAKGEFIAFLDIDDEYRNDYLELMFNAITKTNSACAICNYLEITTETKKAINLKSKHRVLSKNQIYEEIIGPMIGQINDKEEIVWGTVWRTLIRKEYIEKFKLCFDENTAYSEDFLFLIELFSNIDSLCIVKENIYYYYRSQGSALNKYIDNYYEKNQYIHHRLVEILKNNKIYELFEIRYLKNKFRMYTVIISNAVRNNNKTISLKEISKVLSTFNDEFKSIKKYMSFSEKICYFLIKYRFKYTLFILFSLKEKRRIKNYYR